MFFAQVDHFQERTQSHFCSREGFTAVFLRIKIKSIMDRKNLSLSWQRYFLNPENVENVSQWGVFRKKLYIAFHYNSLSLLSWVCFKLAEVLWEQLTLDHTTIWILMSFKTCSMSWCCDSFSYLPSGGWHGNSKTSLCMR